MDEQLDDDYKVKCQLLFSHEVLFFHLLRVYLPSSLIHPQSTQSTLAYINKQ
jgi:hypothetical protein